MNFVVIGTDHRMQHGESGFEGLLQALLGEDYLEPLIAIAEEYHQNTTSLSLAQRLAKERSLHWYQLDMTVEEKQNEGILEEQMSRRGMFQEGVAYRVASDDIREEAWVGKLTQAASGTTLVICGYLHYEALVLKLRLKKHGVDKRAYLETVPRIVQVEEIRSAE